MEKDTHRQRGACTQREIDTLTGGERETERNRGQDKATERRRYTERDREAQ
jgi:hypothetical protein